MIVRGDLAVECGWEKLANIQEEIIAVCKVTSLELRSHMLQMAEGQKNFTGSKHDPAKHSLVSCVMLNKGKHIVEVVSKLFINHL
ncbi:hypothetical protein IGI04_020471 [Brassica rapa subsp. trilocularis]|uniref:Uncharacterized protein n=1 Tax=Brassica rapa subsp. trilocularis TaxID=1813537 RepID=A0ABQ7MIT5_BRACM|nr:hypothetical protein IGI04_020471 [Brassica rapa subsp. trilocularis]